MRNRLYDEAVRQALTMLSEAADRVCGKLNERTDEGVAVSSVAFSSATAKLGIEPGFRITAVEGPSDRPAKEWMFLPALALIGWVAQRQKRRQRHSDAMVEA